MAAALGLPAIPAATATWSDHLYTCTYRLPAGPLVLAVKELNGVPAARVYFDRLRQRVAPTRPIRGLANLGLPGYRPPPAGR